MKRKIGDEVLITAKIKEIEEFPDSLTNYKFEKSSLYFWGTENTIVEPGMTAEEAWEISKKLFADFADHELDEIFGKGWSYPKLMELSPSEAKAKIDGWESKRIHVGDVVYCFADCDDDGWRNNEENCGVVTGIYPNTYHVLMKNGDCADFKKDELEKTGKHIDIQSVLDQIGGDEDV